MEKQAFKRPSSQFSYIERLYILYVDVRYMSTPNFQISQELTECTLEVCQDGELPYVIVVTPAEWHAMKTQLPIELDMELDHNPHPIIKAEVNYNSLTGSLSLLDKKMEISKSGAISL